MLHAVSQLAKWCSHAVSTHWRKLESQCLGGIHSV